MNSSPKICIGEPNLIKASFQAAQPGTFCVLCSLSFEHGDLMCVAYISYASSDDAEILGHICVECRDAGPELIKKQLVLRADKEESQANNRYKEGKKLLARAETANQPKSWLKELAMSFLNEAESSQREANRFREMACAEIQFLQERPEPVCIYLKN